MATDTTRLSVDGEGRLVLPPDLAARLGLVDGAHVRIAEDRDGLRIGRSTATIARVYVEPTTLCNLVCRTCIRNVWDEAPGRMSPDTVARIMESVRAITPRPTVFFGGYGEPFAHPDLLPMVAEAKAAGCAVEVITNGTMLDRETREELVRLRLDRLWVSIDGATADSYADVRLWDALPQVIEDLTALRDLRHTSPTGSPRLGIAFVAMRRNIGDLPEVIRLGERLGADRFSISNVLAHTEALRDQVLYSRSVDLSATRTSPWSPEIALPRIDVDSLPHAALARLAASPTGGARPPARGSGQADTCPFVERGSVSVRWDGAISPCLPLLHTHHSYLDFRPRVNHAFAFGNVNERGLVETWDSEPYADLRERLLAFDFAPCTTCNSCDMADENLEDCFGSQAPACGGCLWAQGFIQCP